MMVKTRIKSPIAAADDRITEEEFIRMNKEYLKNIRQLLDNLENTQEQMIEQVAEACAACIYNGG